MQPVRFIIEVGSPIVLTRFAPQFDALVYAGLYQATNLDHDGLIDKMKSLIKWNEDLGVFHASSMRFGVSADKGLVSKDYVRVDSIKDKLSSENFAPTSRGGKYSKVVTAGGPFKVRMTKRLSYESPYVVFDAFCEPEPIKRLLSNMFVGIGYDSFRAGQGEIRTITHVTLDEDVSIFCNGEVRRNVPINSASGYSGVKSLSPLTPPYYSPEVVECLSAQRVVVLPSTKKLLAV